MKPRLFGFENNKMIYAKWKLIGRLLNVNSNPKDEAAIPWSAFTTIPPLFDFF